jgi:signal transduction histidine kinase
MNALEAVDEGGQITVRLSKRSTNQLILEVEDTGPGVPSELLPNIFDAFVTTKPEGSGLGLAIGRAIANAHHASIRAENSTPGRGLKIIVDFPVPEPTAIEATRENPAVVI